MTNLGETQEKMLKQFRFALEQALSKANFINTSELCVLQAFSLFLVTVRRFDDSRFCWTLTGLVIRLAQGMGLHRDGTQFDLTPFETEMRRRLWWTILILDLRSSEEVGSELTILDTSFDTQMPLNINDADIGPETVDMPPSRIGKSDSAISLVRFEVLKTSRKLLAEMSSRQQRISTAEREEMLVEVYSHVQGKFLQHGASEDDALWWVAAMVTRIIMAKMCLVIYQHHMFPGSQQTELSEDSRQRIYVASMEIVELVQRLNTDARAKQYRWLFMTYTPWHAIAFNLLETCRRRWSPLVERSWEAVSNFERYQVDMEKKTDHAAIFLPMRKLYIRARKHRESELAYFREHLSEARQLDLQERMNPAEARFGPLPWFENRMEQVREKWWGLLRDGNSSEPVPPVQSWSRGTAPGLATSELSPSSVPNSEPVRGYASRIGSDPSTALSDAAMDYMDDFMAQPNLSMAELWPMMIVDSKSGHGIPMDGAASLPGQVANGLPVAQQQGPLEGRAQLSVEDDNLPPYLWPGAYGAPVPPSKPGFGMMAAGDNAVGDMDMGDFDWHDWGQSLQSLDMTGMQQRPL
jgi:hypothetical protein